MIIILLIYYINLKILIATVYIYEYIYDNFAINSKDNILKYSKTNNL